MIEAKGNEPSNIPCPLCGSSGLWIFYKVIDVPASCNRLWSSKDEDINYIEGCAIMGLPPSCCICLNCRIENTFSTGIIIGKSAYVQNR